MSNSSSHVTFLPAVSPCLRPKAESHSHSNRIACSMMQHSLSASHLNPIYFHAVPTGFNHLTENIIDWCNNHSPVGLHLPRNLLHRTVCPEILKHQFTISTLNYSIALKNIRIIHTYNTHPKSSYLYKPYNHTDSTPAHSNLHLCNASAVACSYTYRCTQLVPLTQSFFHIHQGGCSFHSKKKKKF